MAERSIAAVLKTVDLRGSGGSNPSLSADFSEERIYKGREKPDESVDLPLCCKDLDLKDWQL